MDWVLSISELGTNIYRKLSSFTSSNQMRTTDTLKIIQLLLPTNSIPPWIRPTKFFHLSNFRSPLNATRMGTCLHHVLAMLSIDFFFFFVHCKRCPIKTQRRSKFLLQVPFNVAQKLDLRVVRPNLSVNRLPYRSRWKIRLLIWWWKYCPIWVCFEFSMF